MGAGASPSGSGGSTPLRSSISRIRSRWLALTTCFSPSATPAATPAISMPRMVASGTVWRRWLPAAGGEAAPRVAGLGSSLYFSRARAAASSVRSGATRRSLRLHHWAPRAGVSVRRPAPTAAERRDDEQRAWPRGLRRLPRAQYYLPELLELSKKEHPLRLAPFGLRGGAIITGLPIGR